MSEKILGSFEFQVLSAVASLPRDCYGLRILSAMREKTGRSVSIGAVYTTLDRLEKKGLLTSEWGEATSERGGRRKRHYHVTNGAYAAISSTVEAFTLNSPLPQTSFSR